MEIQSHQEEARKAAAEAAVTYIKPGMVIGLGTGNTASFAIKSLAQRKLSSIRCIPTSSQSAKLASNLGLSLIALNELIQEKNQNPSFLIDLTIDGADEIDPELQLIKGKGGALLLEKIVASYSKEVFIIADQEKQVQRLGEKSALPIEVVPFGSFPLLAKLQKTFPHASLRLKEGKPYQTDEGNHLIDLPIDTVPSSAKDLHTQLKMTTGVIETGFFLTEASRVFIGFPNGTTQTYTKRNANKFLI